MTRWIEVVSQQRRIDVLMAIALLLSYADTEAAPTDVVISDTTAAVRKLKLLFSHTKRYNATVKINFILFRFISIMYKLWTPRNKL